MEIPDDMGMSDHNEIKYVPAGSGPAYWGPGDQMTFLITGAETGGAFFLAEASVPAGSGPPPHIHRREDESFYLLEGKLMIQVGEESFHGSPGDFIRLPRGIIHSFKNVGNSTAKLLVLVTPAGLEKFFEETFDPAVDRSAAPPPASQAMFARFLACAPNYGLELMAPAASARVSEP